MNEKIVEGEWTGPRIYTFSVYGWLTEVGRPKWRWMVHVRITWNELIPLLPTPRTPLFTSSLRINWTISYLPHVQITFRPIQITKPTSQNVEISASRWHAHG
jgi:hypothetical protein